MLFITSLFFIRPIFKAWKMGQKFSSTLFTLLLATSVLHHASIPIIPNIVLYDKILAHAAGIYAMIRGIKRHSSAKALPYGAWPLFAYYVLEPRLPPIWQDICHGSIHIVSSEGFTKVLD